MPISQNQLEQYYDRYGQPLVEAPWTPSDIMVSDLNADGKKIYGLSGLSVGYKDVRECCIGIRTATTGGIPEGSGSYDDPWDVSTAAKFDAVMSDVTKAARDNTIIRIRDGEFLHGGGNEWYLRPGCKLIGDGMYSTILKLNPTMNIDSNGANCILSSALVDGDGIYVSDMTVDTNFDAIIGLLNTPAPDGKLNGVVLYGNNNTIERVRHTGGFGIFDSRQESFGLILLGRLGGETTPPHGQKIRDCLVDGYKGNYGGGVVIVGRGADNLCIGSIISGCTVIGMIQQDHVIGTSFDSGACAGIGSGGGVITNCTMMGCQRGIYNEDGSDVKISHCKITNNYEIGIFMNPANQTMEGLTIFDCSIGVRNTEIRRWGIALAHNDSTRTTRGAKISHNRVFIELVDDMDTPPSASADYNPIFMNNAISGLGHSFIGNTCEVNAVNMTRRISLDSFSIGNRGRTGETQPNLPDLGFSNTAAGSSSVSARATAAQTMASDTPAQLLFDTEEWDTLGDFASSTFIAPDDGYYEFRVHVILETNASSSLIYLNLNGVDQGTMAQKTGTSTNDTLIGETVMQLSAGDVITLWGRQTSGGDSDFDLSAKRSYQISKIG